MKTAAPNISTMKRPRRSSPSDSVIARCTQLLASFADSGEREAFDEFATTARPYLTGRANFELGRFGLAIDEGEVVQEVLLNVFRYAHTFRPDVPHAFSTWAARVVRNVVLRYLRKGRGHPTVSIEDLSSLDLTDRRAPEPIRLLIEDEEREELKSNLSLYLSAYYGAYRGLTTLQQDVLQRVAVEGRSYRQVAGDMGMRVEAVKMVIYRARRRLAAEMARAAAG